MSALNTVISLPQYSLAGDIAAYIDKYCMERDRLSLTHLSRQFGTCETTLKESFKYRYGVTVHQYILQLRMALAKKYLVEERFSVKEAALELGYSAMSNFARDFKRVIGITPVAFIKTIAPKLDREIHLIS